MSPKQNNIEKIDTILKEFTDGDYEIDISFCEQLLQLIENKFPADWNNSEYISAIKALIVNKSNNKFNLFI